MKYLMSILFISCFYLVSAQDPYYFTAEPLEGEGIYAFMDRFNLNVSQCNFDKFYELNKLHSNDPLVLNKSYKLPVKIYTYNGTSIRSTIGNPDYENALNIQAYNLNLLANGIRSTDYRESNILWVPYQYLHCTDSDDNIIEEPLFGEKYASFQLIDNSLESQVYYLASGHGGPDPGAIGKYNDHNLCEDEYAYDVTLRLARKLMQHGAKVHIIIQDKNDGIRDEMILPCDHDEITLNRGEIPLNQVRRLRDRTETINNLYLKERNNYPIDQTAVFIHVDSRQKSKRVDVFFMYYKNSEEGKDLARSLVNTFSNKYDFYRENRGYEGHFKTRNLFVLRETVLPGVFIELCNIRNPRDQKRILLKENRQALADWIYAGLVNSSQAIVLK